MLYLLSVDSLGVVAPGLYYCHEILRHTKMEKTPGKDITERWLSMPNIKEIRKDKTG